MSGPKRLNSHKFSYEEAGLQTICESIIIASSRLPCATALPLYSADKQCKLAVGWTSGLYLTHFLYL